MIMVTLSLFELVIRCLLVDKVSPASYSRESKVVTMAKLFERQMKSLSMFTASSPVVASSERPDPAASGRRNGPIVARVAPDTLTLTGGTGLLQKVLPTKVGKTSKQIPVSDAKEQNAFRGVCSSASDCLFRMPLLTLFTSLILSYRCSTSHAQAAGNPLPRSSRSPLRSNRTSPTLSRIARMR